jgi:hypothetical protein
VTVLFGDGAGAVLLGCEETGDAGAGVLYTKVGADGSGALDLYMKVFEIAKAPYLDYDAHDDEKNHNRFPWMNGKRVFLRAVRAMVQSTQQALATTGLTWDQIDWFVPHQANQRILDGTAKKLGIDEDKAWHPVQPCHPVKIGPGVVATPFPVPHDAANPVAWRVAAGGKAAIVATDLGHYPAGWDLFCKGATHLLLEANYHPALLATCDYIESTKKRIAETHMSVLDVADWVKDKMPESVEQLFVGHISNVSCDVKIVRHLTTQAAMGKGLRLEVISR